MDWEIEGIKKEPKTFLIVNQGMKNPQNPRYARVNLNENSLSMVNAGFRSMGVKENNT